MHTSSLFKQAAIFLISLFLLPSSSFAELSDKIKIDLQKKLISEALKDQNCPAALEHIITLQDIQESISAEFKFHAGECYYQTDNYFMAIISLGEYLEQSNKKDDFYEMALSIYLKAEKKLEERKKNQIQKKQKLQQKTAKNRSEIIKKKQAMRDSLADLKRQMKMIEPGCFYMGSLENDDEKPLHKVCITKPYRISQFEVTRKYWETVMGEDTRPDMREKCLSQNCPVKSVSWNNVQVFIRTLNSITGQKYRLPSEAEWEYACRNVGKNQQPCYQPSLDSLKWYLSNSQKRTYPVGQNKGNAIGLYDMNINVKEWVQDYYDRNYYQQSSLQYDPKGPSQGTQRIIRSGCCYGYSSRRDNNRIPMQPNLKNPYIGFRLAEDMDNNASGKK